MKDNENVLLEEYRTLREEILKMQDMRMVILGFTITIIGIIFSVTLQQDINNNVNNFKLLPAFSILIVIAALIFTIYLTQQIDKVAGYIRKFIEPNFTYLKWETRWMIYRNLLRSNPKAGGLPSGASKPITVFYFILTIGIYFSAYSIFKLYEESLSSSCIIISFLAIVSLLCTYELYARKTSGWKINWDLFEK